MYKEDGGGEGVTLLPALFLDDFRVVWSPVEFEQQQKNKKVQKVGRVERSAQGVRPRNVWLLQVASVVEGRKMQYPEIPQPG